MTIELRWLASLSASSLHAAEAIAGGRTLVDTRIQNEMADPAAALLADLQSLGIATPSAWDHLIALSAGIQNNRELVDVTLRKTRGGSQNSAAATPLAGRIADVEAAISRAVPNMVEQLELRSRPLREQWDARGPGLFRALARQIEKALLVERADVSVVYPVLGGSGHPHLLYNSVRFEAVLANPIPQLPEVLRLGWLLSQLNCELPRFSERVPGQRLPHVAGLALLPPILVAAEEVELASLNQPLLKLAVESWQPHLADDAAALARLLLDWWATYDATRPSWAVAMQALDQMLMAERL